MTTIEVQPVSDIIPSPRIGACMTSMNNYLFLFGGLTSQGLNSELWAYNISQNKYELFPSLYVQPPASAYSSCHAEYEEGSIVIYVYFGRTYGDTPLSCIYKYNLGTKTWVEVRKNTYEVTLSRTRSIIIKFNEKLLIIAGEQWSTRVLNDIVEMNYKTGEYKKVGNLPFGIYNSAGVYFKDKVYIFGGGSSFGLTLLINSTRNLFLEISMNKECGDNCNWPCSLGSYRTEFGCQTCPQGYYSNSLGDDFLPCPEGTYGNTKGADSIRQCYPCPEKTFNDIQGSPFCKICSETYVCLAGSITHSIKRFSSNGLTSSQPKAYKRLEGIDDQVAGIQYGGGFICLFILILFLLVTRLRNKLDRLDMFDESHNYDPEQCMRLRSTKIGGAFTIIYIFIILTYVAASALIFALDNIEEIKNLVPSIIYEDENFIIEAKEVYISFMFENYGGDCDETVDDKLNIYTNDMFAKLLRKKVTKNEGNCYVDLYYENWSVGFEAELELYIQEENSYASAIFTNITASSSIPDEYSSVTTYIRPPENTIFKGYNPTQINIQATPSIFKSDSTKWPSEEMGYHIAINENSDIGSYIQMLDYPFTSEIKVKLNFKRDTSVLVTTRKFKQDALIFLGSLLGALSGFLELVEFAMGKVEANYTELALKYKKHVKLRGIHDHAVLLKNSLASKIRGSLDSRSPTTSIKLLRKSKFFQISELHKLKLDKHKLQSEEIERQLI